MDKFDPVVDYVMEISGEPLLIGMTENAYEISHIGGGESHNHSRFEMHIILDGKCQADVDGNSHTLRAGQVLIVAPGQYHRIAPASSDCRRLVIGATTSTPRLTQDLRRAVERSNCLELTRDLTEPSRSILHESEAGLPFGRELMRLRMAEVVVMLLRMLGLEEPSKLPSEEVFRPQDVIDNYFESHMAKNPGADELAELLHMSRRNLDRVLKSVYGMGFREKLLRTRLDQAKWLLRHTDKPVSAIAVEVGYAHDSAFRQAFRQQFGIAPFEYRLRRRRDTEKETTT